jgi:DNA repair exonuclease SbcCD ATPase subunit
LEKEQEKVAKLKNRLRDRDEEITGRQADLKKEKEAVAELKQRLRNQDVEITGRRVELMNSQAEVDRLQTKVKSLENLLATEEKQPARLLYEKFTHRQKQELSQAQAESRLAREALKRLERQKRISEEKNNELMKSFAEQNEDLRKRLESANAKISQQFAQIKSLKTEIRDLEETEEIQRRSIEHLKDKLEISGSTLADEEESTPGPDQGETQSSNPIVAAAAAANEENAENSLTFHPISQLERCSLGALRPSSLVNQSLQTMTSEHDHHRQDDSSQTIEEEDSQGRIKSSDGLRSTSHFETLSSFNSSSSVDPRRSCPPPNGQKTFKTVRSSLQFSSPLCLPRLDTSLTTPTSVATSSRLHQPPP